jgi:transcriptional regulator with XRE-family HTH domain
MKQFSSFNVGEYRRRLKLLRKVYGENQTEFASRVGIAFKKWNHYERGYPLSREAAFILHEKIPGLDPSWLYWGYEGNLAVDLRDRIRKAEREA